MSGFKVCWGDDGYILTSRFMQPQLDNPGTEQITAEADGKTREMGRRSIARHTCTSLTYGLTARTTPDNIEQTAVFRTDSLALPDPGPANQQPPLGECSQCLCPS